MISAEPILTNSGLEMLIRAIGGETLTFTGFAFGAGELPAGDTGASRTTLIDQKMTIPIGSMTRPDDGTLHVMGHFDSSDIPQQFVCREVGLMAQIGNETPRLYAYANNGDNSALLKPSFSDPVISQTIVFAVAIGNAQNVTAEFVDDTEYALAEHSHDASDILTGVLPISRGGTGTGDFAELFNLIRVVAVSPRNDDYEDDCDAWVDAGLYYGNGTEDHNPFLPRGRTFILIAIEPGNGYVIQLAIGFDLTNNTTGNLFARAGSFADDGSIDEWYSWKSCA